MRRTFVLLLCACGSVGDVRPDSGFVESDSGAACPSGLTPCGSDCIDTTSDTANCGKCGGQCSMGAACVSGVCTCPPTSFDCSGRCTIVATDPANCGQCGHDCCGGDCEGRQCQPHVLTTGASGWRIKVDGNAVYWQEKDAIRSMSKTGGAVATAVVAPSNDHFTLDANNFYWTSSSGDVSKAARNGGNTIVLASGQPNPTGIAVDGTNVYWVSSATSQSVMRVPIAGGTATPMADILSASIGGEITLDSSFLYVSSHQPGDVARIPLLGGGPTFFGKVPGASYGIAVDATYIYWGSFGVNSPYAVGQSLKTMLFPTGVAGGPGAVDLALDNANVYWAAADAIKSFPISAGPMHQIAYGLKSPLGLALDDKCIYFTSGDTIQVVAKPLPF